jgi:hypothetical protein
VTLARWGYRQGISGVVDVEWPTPPADGFAGPFALARWLREALEPVVRRVADEADATDADGQLARRLRRRAFETAVAEQLEAIRREGGATLAAAVRGELPDDPERCIEALDKLGDLRLGELAAELAQRLLDGATPDEDEAVALFSLLCAEGDRFDSVFAALDAVNYRFDLRRSYRRELRTIGQDAAKAAKALRRKPSTKPSERTVQAEAEARGRNPWLWTASAESLDELRSLAEAERGQIEDRLNWASANWDELGEVRERLAARTDVRRLAAERLDGYLAAGWVSDAVAFVQQAASYGLAEGKRRTHDEEPGEEILARLADARVLLDRPLLDVAAGADTDTLALLALPRLAGDSADAWFALSATDDEDGSWRTHGNRDSEAALPVPVPDTADAVGALVRRLLVAPQRSGRIPRSYWVSGARSGPDTSLR